MTAYSEFTKEQLVELLKKTENDDSEDFVVEKCLYKALRPEGTVCTNNAYVEWGYCKKHSRTVQANNAARRWKESVKKEEENAAKKDLAKKKEDEKKELAKKELAKKEEDEKELAKKVGDEKKDAIKKNLGKKEVVEKKKKAGPPFEKKKKRILTIKPNKWGRYEDPETSILFNPIDKQAYGTQNKVTGNVQSLTDDDIKICIMRGYKYTVIDDSDDSEDESESIDSDCESDIDY